MGKVVVNVIKSDIQAAVGPLQTCAGLKSGIEANIHAMKEAWDDSYSEGALLVDADNAFNRLNRHLAIHNIREICPPFHRYLSNTYQVSAKMIVNGDGKSASTYISSDEGCTQGDVTAMHFYALTRSPTSQQNVSRCY